MMRVNSKSIEGLEKHMLMDIQRNIICSLQVNLTLFDSRRG